MASRELEPAGQCPSPLQAEIEEGLGEVYETKPTNEMFEQEVSVETTDEESVSVSTDSWTSPPSWE